MIDNRCTRSVADVNESSGSRQGLEDRGIVGTGDNEGKGTVFVADESVRDTNAEERNTWLIFRGTAKLSLESNAPDDRNLSAEKEHLSVGS